MSEHIIGRLVQTSKSHQYQPGDCRCFHCSAFSPRIPCNTTNNIRDWQVGVDNCCGGFCTTQPRCVHPDRNECEIGRSSKGQDPLIFYGWDKKAPNIQCVYNLDKIDTRKQVLAYTDKFGENNDIEAQYCTQKVKSCPKGMKECSRLKSIGEGGDECRKWFEKQPTFIKNATMQNYCLRHNTEDCKCINRSENQAYQAMKGAHSINDGCWYTACANKSKYLVPPHLINPECPDKLCQVLYDIIDTGNVSIDNVQNDIVCKFDKKPGKQPVPVPEPPVPEPPVPEPPVPEPDIIPSFIPETLYRFVKRYSYELISITVLIIILIVVMINSDE
jgi:hypothetical protein